MNRTLTLAALILASGVGGALLEANALHPAQEPFHIVLQTGAHQHGAHFTRASALQGGAQRASAASLGVNVIVTATQSNATTNSYTETVGLASNDTSGLTNWSMSWGGTGTTPRYALNATGTITLP